MGYKTVQFTDNFFKVNFIFVAKNSFNLMSFVDTNKYYSCQQWNCSWIHGIYSFNNQIAKTRCVKHRSKVLSLLALNIGQQPEHIWIYRF